MAQASSWWRRYRRLISRIDNQIMRWVPSTAQWRRKSRRDRVIGRWVGLLTLVVAMLLWNWQLLLATSVGIAVMLLVYFLQQWDWQQRWSSLGQMFTGANRQLAVAVGSGGVATLGSYMAVSVWIDADSAWIATGAILQGLGTLAIMILLVGQLLRRPTQQRGAELDRWIEQLTDSHPLRRLIAVRQLTRIAQRGVSYVHKYPVEDKHTIADYLLLMLPRETEPVVRNAVIDGLQGMAKLEKPTSNPEEISIPVDLKPNSHEYTAS